MADPKDPRYWTEKEIDADPAGYRAAFATYYGIGTSPTTTPTAPASTPQGNRTTAPQDRTTTDRNFTAENVAKERQTQLASGRYFEEQALIDRGFWKAGDGAYINPQTRETWNVDNSSGLWSTNGYRANATDYAAAKKANEATTAAPTPTTPGQTTQGATTLAPVANRGRNELPYVEPGFARAYINVDTGNRRGVTASPFATGLSVDLPQDYSARTLFGQERRDVALPEDRGFVTPVGTQTAEWRGGGTGLGFRSADVLGGFRYGSTGDTVKDAVLAGWLSSERDRLMGEGFTREQAQNALSARGANLEDLDVGDRMYTEGPMGLQDTIRTDSGYEFRGSPVEFDDGGFVTMGDWWGDASGLVPQDPAEAQWFASQPRRIGETPGQAYQRIMREQQMNPPEFSIAPYTGRLAGNRARQAELMAELPPPIEPYRPPRERQQRSVYADIPRIPSFATGTDGVVLPEEAFIVGKSGTPYARFNENMPGPNANPEVLSFVSPGAARITPVRDMLPPNAPPAPTGVAAMLSPTARAAYTRLVS